MITPIQFTSKLFALIVASSPQILSADEFTGADVLEWTEDSQNALFQNSIMMIGIVATRSPDTANIASCIDEWYAADSLSDRQDEIREALRIYPDFHPQAVVLAVVEKACGGFDGG